MYQGVWQNQGTVINDSGDYSSGDGGNFWDWWSKNGDTAVDAASDVYCLLFPNSQRCKRPPQYDPRYYPPQQDKTLIYVLGAAVLVLIIVLVLKK